MPCPQCEAIEDVFDAESAEKERRAFLKDGPDKQEQLLISALLQEGVQDASLIDIGGGVGALPVALLEAGASQATAVEASTGYITSSRKLMDARNLADRVRYEHGDFVEIAPTLEPADIVTLVRSVCCYPDMQGLVGLSSERARRLYGLIYPRDTWWLRSAFRIAQPFFQFFWRTSFQFFVHPTEEVEAIIHSKGFKRRFYKTSGIWQ
ncbi:MAG: methyltransferase, partial [Anaerolineales bacterium]|nr:methyltransferase [Anaerolineales bacterium]